MKQERRRFMEVSLKYEKDQRGFQNPPAFRDGFFG